MDTPELRKHEGCHSSGHDKHEVLEPYPILDRYRVMITLETFRPVPEVEHEDDQCVEGEEEGVEQQKMEDMVVRLTHTVVDPWAVMVHSYNTLLTPATVVGLVWTIPSTPGTHLPAMGICITRLHDWYPAWVESGGSE